MKSFSVTYVSFRILYLIIHKRRVETVQKHVLVIRSENIFTKIRTDEDLLLGNIFHAVKGTDFFKRRGAGRLESFEMFIFSCIRIAPYRRVFRKLCLLLPILLVEMFDEHRMHFCCKIFLVKHSVLGNSFAETTNCSSCEWDAYQCLIN